MAVEEAAHAQGLHIGDVTGRLESEMVFDRATSRIIFCSCMFKQICAQTNTDLAREEIFQVTIGAEQVVSQLIISSSHQVSVSVT